MIQKENFFTVPLQSQQTQKNTNHVTNKAAQSKNGLSFRNAIRPLIKSFSWYICTFIITQTGSWSDNNGSSIRSLDINTSTQINIIHNQSFTNFGLPYWLNCTDIFFVLSLLSLFFCELSCLVYYPIHKILRNVVSKANMIY